MPDNPILTSISSLSLNHILRSSMAGDERRPSVEDALRADELAQEKGWWYKPHVLKLNFLMVSFLPRLIPLLYNSAHLLI